MEIVAILLATCIGFLAGMYITTQISEWIDKQIKK